jgi:hypothetical protein
MAPRGHLDVGITASIVAIVFGVALIDAGTRVWGWPPFTDWPWYAELAALVGAVLLLVAGAAWESRRRWPRSG